MLFSLYSFFLTAFLGMVDYAANDMIGFFYNYFQEENLMYDYPEKVNERPFLIPNKLTGEIFYFCLYKQQDYESMLDYDFHYLKENNNKENSKEKKNDKNIINLNKNKYKNKNKNKIDIDNNKKNNRVKINKIKKVNNLRNLGVIYDPDWDVDEPDILNTNCKYLKNDINMLYTSFYSFANMDKKLTAITATIAYLAYIGAIALVFTIKKLEDYWRQKGKYGFNSKGTDDNSDSNSDNSSNSNTNTNSDNKKNKKKNKKVGNYIKIDENLKKNLIDTTNNLKSKKKSNKISNKDEEEDEDDED
jgi:hypothetical protein